MRIGLPPRQCGRFSREGKLAAALLALFLTIPSSASGQAMVLHTFVSRDPSPKLEELLYLAAGVELMREGLSSTRTGNGESYLLVTDYTPLPGAVTVRYALAMPDAPTHPLAQIAETFPLDQSLDEKIGEAIASLLKAAKIEVAPSPDARIVGLLPQGPAAVGATEGPRRQPESQEPSVASSPAGPPPARPPKITAARGARKGLDLNFASSVSAAGVLFFGQMTEYFHYGVAGLAQAGVAMPRKSVTLGVGAELSLIRVINDYGVIGGPLYLSTAGVNLRVSTPPTRPIRVGAEVSGGAALVAVAAPEQTLVQTEPYAALGAHVLVSLGKRLSLGGGVRFLAIFDNGLLIMGAVPSLTVGIGP